MNVEQYKKTMEFEMILNLWRRLKPAGWLNKQYIKVDVHCVRISGFLLFLSSIGHNLPHSEFVPETIKPPRELSLIYADEY